MLNIRELNVPSSFLIFDFLMKSESERASVWESEMENRYNLF